MTIKNSATAKYQGLGKEGKGFISTGSGAFDSQPYGFNTRFEDKVGTNPEEQIAAAHASCFTMALSFALAEEGYKAGDLETKAEVTLVQEGDDFTVTKSELTLDAEIDKIERAELLSIADKAKSNCPISKLLNCEISLTVK